MDILGIKAHWKKTKFNLLEMVGVAIHLKFCFKLLKISKFS